MNRLALMILRNLHHIPGLWFKLCHYAKHTDEYPEEEIELSQKVALRAGPLASSSVRRESCFA